MLPAACAACCLAGRTGRVARCAAVRATSHAIRQACARLLPRRRELLLLQLGLLQDPAAPVSEAARQGLLAAYRAAGLGDLLPTHILPTPRRAVGMSSSGGAAAGAGDGAA